MQWALEGLRPVVDLNRMEVIRVDDYGAIPIPTGEANYEKEFIKTTRKPLKPIDVVQPDTGRRLALSTSKDLENWSQPRTVMYPDERGQPAVKTDELQISLLSGR